MQPFFLWARQCMIFFFPFLKHIENFRYTTRPINKTNPLPSLKGNVELRCMRYTLRVNIMTRNTGFKHHKCVTVICLHSVNNGQSFRNDYFYLFIFPHTPASHPDRWVGRVTGTCRGSRWLRNLLRCQTRAKHFTHLDARNRGTGEFHRNKSQ